MAVHIQEYRERLKILLIETLGFAWGKEHLLLPYKHLNRVPRRDWPALLTMAEHDAAVMIHDAKVRETGQVRFPLWPPTS